MQQKKNNSGIKNRLLRVLRSFVFIGFILTTILGSLLVGYNYFVAKIPVSDSLLFIGRFVSSPLSIGAIAPSGPALARAMGGRIPSESHRKLLEVGAGTGVFTVEIVSQMGPGDRLDIVETDPDMTALLRQRFGKDPRISIHHQSITEWRPRYQYDAIISGLPFKSFPYQLVHQIMEQYMQILRPGGVLSYFSYQYLGQIKKHVFRDREYRAVDNYLKELHHRFDHDVVYVSNNMPPAEVHYITFSRE